MIFVINLLLTLFECPKIPGCKQCNDEQTICHTCDTNLHYNSSPSGKAECSCNHDELYYEYSDDCRKVSSENCDIGCKYCFIDTHKCAECDSSKHFESSYGSCYCNSYDFFELGTGDDADKCVCMEGYKLYKDTRCAKIEHDCYSGCKSCYGFDHTCIECKENFEIKINISNSTCYCKDGYVLDKDEYSYYDQCIDAFPTSCPEGCICDDMNSCISCNENYIPTYYNDHITIKSCNKTFDCPQEMSDICSKCDENGNCVTCKQGYIYSQKKSICIRRDESIKCHVFNCLQCSPSNYRGCEACPTGYNYDLIYNSNEINCILQTDDPLRILYYELADSNIIEKPEIGKVNINLQKLQPSKKRPYYYLVDKNDQNIIINNEDNIDFQFRLPKTNGDNEVNLKITNSDSSDNNPPYNIKLNGKINLNYQSSNISLEGAGEATLNSEQGQLEINKITIADSAITINHNSDIRINEVNIYHSKKSNDLEFISSKDSRSNLNVYATTFKLHQNSKVKVSKIDIDTLIASSKSSVIAESITIQNIEINLLGTSIDGQQNYMLNGNISGIPKTISLKITHDKSLLDEGHVYIPYGFHFVNGENVEFINNCEKWAKIYNSKPTDEFYNKAACQKIENTAQIIIRHEEDDDESKTGMIIGIVVACIVVVGLVIFLLVYFLVIKKRRQNKDNSSTQQDVEEPSNDE